MKIYGKSTEEVAKAFKKGEITVAVFGLGKMGLPLAALFADNGAIVIGADISQRVVDMVNDGTNHVKEEPGLSELVKKNSAAGRLTATTDLVSAGKNADVKIILVPTLIRDHKPDMAPVYSVAEKIASGLEVGDVVITECTMPPGSTELLIPILEKSGLKCGRDFGLGHCPERTMTGTAIQDIRGRYPKIVGAIDEKTKHALVGMYSVINSKGVIPVSGIRAAELVKVLEGVYRDVNIGLANELTLVCEKNKVDYVEVQEAANTQPFCHLHRPGGVGGHCIPYYPYFVMDEQTKLIRTARHVNEEIPARIADMAAGVLEEAGRDIKKSNILVLGIAFRGGVKETIKSTSLEVIPLLKERAANVYAYDPLYTKEETEKFGLTYKDDYKDVDCVVLMADHAQFKALDWEETGKEMRTRTMVDSRQMIVPAEIRRKGFFYKGIGYV